MVFRIAPFILFIWVISPRLVQLCLYFVFIFNIFSKYLFGVFIFGWSRFDNGVYSTNTSYLILSICFECRLHICLRKQKVWGRRYIISQHAFWHSIASYIYEERHSLPCAVNTKEKIVMNLISQLRQYRGQVLAQFFIIKFMLNE